MTMGKTQPKTLTDFQRRVYAAVRRIPRGSVTTYRLLAMALGRGGSCRAVGQALRANPLAPKTPCHRVIASDLSIGGFRGATEGTAIARKTALLEREGVAFANGKLCDPGRVFRFRHGGSSVPVREAGSPPRTAP